MTEASDKRMDGSRVAKELLAACQGRVKRIQDQTGVTPCLATVLVGEDPASVVYTRMKRRRCEKIGMKSLKVELPESTDTAGLVAEIEKLGADPDVHGILLQHPAPVDDERAAFEAIPVEKDVDGVTWGSFARMYFPEEAAARGGFGSCTPAGIMRLLDAYDVPLEGAEAVVIGRSAILGRPLAGMLLARNATVTICHSRTRDLPEVVRRADVVVAAVGRPNFVRGDWLKPGAVVMDAGYNEGNIGDCEFESCEPVARLITPVPGGVGPMTIAVLIEQTVEACELQLGI
ncbi:MAG: tetrahydrofolate dehydrogenase/cyclohydrolase catalytic domain-containing protein [Myxococcota bacterium]|nr:tetrahydrofolate dehydrogenase/cyclohydrolase catalytic domain-containing protein [Myxococcota bacterium]